MTIFWTDLFFQGIRLSTGWGGGSYSSPSSTTSWHKIIKSSWVEPTVGLFCICNHQPSQNTLQRQELFVTVEMGILMCLSPQGAQWPVRVRRKRGLTSWKDIQDYLNLPFRLKFFYHLLFWRSLLSLEHKCCICNIVPGAAKVHFNKTNLPFAFTQPQKVSKSNHLPSDFVVCEFFVRSIGRKKDVDTNCSKSDSGTQLFVDSWYPSHLTKALRWHPRPVH